VDDRLVGSSQLQQALRQFQAGLHVRAGFHDPPEMPGVILERFRPEQARRGLYGLLKQGERILSRCCRFAQQQTGVDAVRRHFESPPRQGYLPARICRIPRPIHESLRLFKPALCSVALWSPGPLLRSRLRPWGHCGDSVGDNVQLLSALTLSVTQKRRTPIAGGRPESVESLALRVPGKAPADVILDRSGRGDR